MKYALYIMLVVFSAVVVIGICIGLMFWMVDLVYNMLGFVTDLFNF